MAVHSGQGRAVNVAALAAVRVGTRRHRIVAKRPGRAAAGVGIPRVIAEQTSRRGAIFAVAGTTCRVLRCSISICAVCKHATLFGAFFAKQSCVWIAFRCAAHACYRICDVAIYFCAVGDLFAKARVAIMTTVAVRSALVPIDRRAAVWRRKASLSNFIPLIKMHTIIIQTTVTRFLKRGRLA